jgi:hypothetical protein
MVASFVQIILKTKGEKSHHLKKSIVKVITLNIVIFSFKKIFLTTQIM